MPATCRARDKLSEVLTIVCSDFARSVSFLFYLIKKNYVEMLCKQIYEQISELGGDRNPVCSLLSVFFGEDKPIPASHAPRFRPIGFVFVLPDKKNVY